MAGVLLQFRHICGFWVHQWNLRVKDMPPIAKVGLLRIYQDCRNFLLEKHHSINISFLGFNLWSPVYLCCNLTICKNGHPP